MSLRESSQDTILETVLLLEFPLHTSNILGGNSDRRHGLLGVMAREERIKHDMYSGKNISMGMYLCLARLEEEIAIDGRQGVGEIKKGEGCYV
jgi:hypothetical protein